MSKSAKIWLIVAGSLVLIGCIIFGGVMTMLKWDFLKLSTEKYETNTHEINEEFNNISVKTSTADVRFVPSEDGECKVVCYEDKKEKHDVSVQDGTLTIEAFSEKKWYDYIGITFKSPKITVYLPTSEYDLLAIKESTGDIEISKDFKFESIDISLSTGDVKNYASATDLIKIKTSTGDINIENVSAGAFDLSVSTGDITASSIECASEFKVSVSTGKTKVSDVNCQSFVTSGSTGDVIMKNVIATEKFSIKRSTGDLKFEKCDASEILVKTDTGDVKGSLLSDKIFMVETDTGKIDVPQSTSGGKCEISTDTGDIKISISAK